MNQIALVSIVIPTYNRKKSAERLIRSILKSTYKKIEIIVIDDCSLDLTSKYLTDKFGKNNKVNIFRNNKNLYTAGTRNEGQKRAKGDLIFFVDDDNVLEKDTIEHLVNAFISDKLLGAAGPVNYNFNHKKKVLWFLTRRNMTTTKTYQPRNLSEVRGRDIWETADIPNAFMVRSDVIKKNRIMFKKEFGIMYEESDYAYRIRKAGFSIKVVRKAKIYHDIEVAEKGKKAMDYMYHFMNDKRRPFVFARNRILFHKLYSSRLQLIIILGFWVWLFSAYYMYRIISYSGYGNFSIPKRIELAVSYLKGTFIGISSVLNLSNAKI